MENQPIIQPGTSYNIPEDAIIQLIGKEFTALFQYLEAYVNSPLYQLSMATGQLHQAMFKKLEGAVISGIAIPVKKSEEIEEKVLPEQNNTVS